MTLTDTKYLQTKIVAYKQAHTQTDSQTQILKNKETHKQPIVPKRKHSIV